MAQALKARESSVKLGLLRSFLDNESSGRGMESEDLLASRNDLRGGQKESINAFVTELDGVAVLDLGISVHVIDGVTGGGVQHARDASHFVRLLVNREQSVIALMREIDALELDILTQFSEITVPCQPSS